MSTTREGWIKIADGVVHPMDLAAGRRGALWAGTVYRTPAGVEVLDLGGSIRRLPRDWLHAQPTPQPGESASWDAFIAMVRRQPHGRARADLLEGAGLTEADLD